MDGEDTTARPTITSNAATAHTSLSSLPLNTALLLQIVLWTPRFTTPVISRRPTGTLLLPIASSIRSTTPVRTISPLCGLHLLVPSRMMTCQDQLANWGSSDNVKGGLGIVMRDVSYA